jgi:hypothetical protein
MSTVNGDPVACQSLGGCCYSNDTMNVRVRHLRPPYPRTIQICGKGTHSSMKIQKNWCRLRTDVSGRVDTILTYTGICSAAKTSAHRPRSARPALGHDPNKGRNGWQCKDCALPFWWVNIPTVGHIERLSLISLKSSDTCLMLDHQFKLTSPPGQLDATQLTVNTHTH